MNKLHVKSGDTVIVLSGKDKGKKGKVLGADIDNGKVLVEGINMVVRHTKPRSNRDQGGRLNKECMINASKVMKVCPKCGKASKTEKQILENGQKVSLCKKCRETIEK